MLSWVRVGASWCVLGASWGVLGVSYRRLGADLGTSWGYFLSADFGTPISIYSILSCLVFDALQNVFAYFFPVFFFVFCLMLCTVNVFDN